MPNARFGYLKRYEYPPGKNCQSIFVAMNHVSIFRLVFPSKFGDGILENVCGLCQYFALI